MSVNQTHLGSSCRMVKTSHFFAIGSSVNQTMKGVNRQIAVGQLFLYKQAHSKAIGNQLWGILWGELKPNKDEWAKEG